MAGRTTRRKIKDQGDKIMQDLTRVLEHLKFLSDLANEQSGYIKENLPGIVLMTEGFTEVMENFIGGL